ncbi:hypothetical protein [Wolbachia endosymbiont (group A) of Andrena hattorfiana]|nr:hypothetical protein [Wolbachia endosymbiont (group A) of Andrena hattorfiana]
MNFDEHVKEGALYCQYTIDISELVSFLQNRTDKNGKVFGIILGV